VGRAGQPCPPHSLGVTTRAEHLAVEPGWETLGQQLLSGSPSVIVEVRKAPPCRESCGPAKAAGRQFDVPGRHQEPFFGPEAAELFQGKILGPPRCRDQKQQKPA